MSLNNSEIQNAIISRLKDADTLRYSELQDKTIPNDLFNYHLQFLVKKGLIEKSTNGYKLSSTGIKLVADPFTISTNNTNFFKFNVITIVSRIRNGKIEVVNQLRKSNPSYGKTGVTGGVIQKGELIEEAATRKLFQETGLKAKFKLIGINRRILYKDNELFSDILFPIAYANKYEGDLVEHTRYGDNFWTPINEAIKNDSNPFDSIKKIKDVLIAIEDGTIESLPFFFEESIQTTK